MKSELEPVVRLADARTPKLRRLRRAPAPPMPSLDHLIALAEFPINETKTLLGFVRLFAKAGTAAEGMPIYTVVLGASAK
jgi:hypothetical protein